MRAICLYTFFAISIPAACHAEPNSMILNAFHTAEQKTSLAPEIQSQTILPVAETAISFNWRYDDLYSVATTSFSYKKRYYTVRVIFERGAYDETVKDYVSVPNILVVDVSDLSAPKWMIHIDNVSSVSAAYEAIDAKENKFKIDNNAETKKLTIFAKSAFGEKEVFSIPHVQLFQLWEKAAAKNKLEILGKTYYFLTQIHTTGTLEQLGIAISESTPLYPKTGIPHDVISPCTLTKSFSFSCKDIVYSIPLGIKFNFLSGPNPNTNASVYWRPQEMENPDLYDALDDEALDYATAHPN